MGVAESVGELNLRRIGFVLAVLGLLLFVAMTPKLVELAQDDLLSDVRAYYDAGARLNAGEPLYPADADVNASEYYRYPPLLAIVFRPVAALVTYEVAALGWGVAMGVAFVATVVVLGWRRRSVWFAIAALSFPIAWTLLLGQAQSLVTLLLSLVNPAAVALAGPLKVVPALAAVYWLGRREWRPLGVFAVCSVALILTQLVLEPAGTLAYLEILNLGQVGDIINLSPYALSPMLWAALATVGLVATIVLAPSRFGWAAAVAFATLVSPRLIAYLLMALLAGLGVPWGSRRGSSGSEQSA
jgi:hypothetical protein